MAMKGCCEKIGLKKGKWTAEEDEKLINYIKANGEGSWRSISRNAGLLRCGKSCRLRWVNYLRTDVKRGNFTKDEDETIVKLQETLGNKWSSIASHLPGRTDNEIKNYWNTNLSRRTYQFKSKKMAGRVSRALAKTYDNNSKDDNSLSATTNIVEEQGTSRETEMMLMRTVPWEELDLDVHLGNFEEGGGVAEINTLVNDEREREIMERDCGDGGIMHPCASPNLSYFNDEEPRWDLLGAIEELNPWS